MRSFKKHVLGEGNNWYELQLAYLIQEIMNPHRLKTSGETRLNLYISILIIHDGRKKRVNKKNLGDLYALRGKYSTLLEEFQSFTGLIEAN